MAVLANFKGNNSAPSWSPDGKRLAIVLTHAANSQVYVINADGSLKTPAYATVLQNGVLIQDHIELEGQTFWIGKPNYEMHGASPISLQSHGDPSEPISFRNIWIRSL